MRRGVAVRVAPFGELVLALLLVTVVLAGVGTAEAALPSGALLMYDPSRGVIVVRVPLGVQPLRVSYGARAFWVVSPGAHELIRVDPRSRSVDRYDVGEEPYDVVVAGATAWIADHDGYRILRLDLRTRTLIRSPNLGNPQLALTYAFGSIWAVGADDQLRRLAPRRLSLTGSVPEATISSEGFEPKVVRAGKNLWVSDAVNNAVTRVDPSRLRVTGRWKGAGNGLAVSAGGVWSAEAFTNVVRYTNGSTATVRIGGGPIDVAAGAGSVWTVTRFTRKLVRIDPVALHADRHVPLAATPVAVATGGRFVAVGVR